MDIALLVLCIALFSAVGVIVLFVVLVCGIRAADRRRDFSGNAHTPVEQVSRRVLLYTLRYRRADDPLQTQDPPGERRR